LLSDPHVKVDSIWVIMNLLLMWTYSAKTDDGHKMMQKLAWPMNW